MQLINGECLKEMDKLIDQGIKVDAIITDQPYGTTACKRDSVIPFEAMRERLNKLIKPNGAIVLFGSEPFSSALRMSNIKNYRYDWIWNKNRSGSFALAKKRPFQFHELIHIFYKKQSLYNPQFREYAEESKGDKRKVIKKANNSITKTQNIKMTDNFYDYNRGAYPKMIIDFKVDRANRVHPTQKPVALMEYLIKTYTNEGETVLDFTMGSGTTGVACQNTNREFIGIELDKGYYDIACKRIEESKNLFNNLNK